MAVNSSTESASAVETRKGSIAQSSFVGRSREIAILRDAVSDAVSGRGRLMMLSGEPGIGKTRLAEETVSHARASGARVRWGRCWEDGGAPAFWPWIQVIRECVREKDETGPKLAQMGSGLSYIARMVPELQSVFALQEPLREDDSGIRPGPSFGPTAERFRLFDAIASLFKVLVATAPLAIVLDDLHAADEDSLLLLRFIARELKQLRILIIATFREVEARQSAPLRDLLSDIGREGSLIPLRGLDPGEVADFIRNNAPVVDAELASSLHQATEGNPFFLDEIVRLIIAEREPGASSRHGLPFRIPDSVRSAVYRRVAPLSEGTRSILTTASVIGNEFELAVLREVSDLPAEQVLSSLEEALTQAVIVAQDAVGHYRFSHAIISETLHTGLGAAARAQLHQRIASALEQVHSVEPGPHLARLAHHQVQALPLGDAHRAFEYARRGAEYARNQLAFGETVRLYRMALQALAATPKPNEAQQCEVLLEMGEALAQGANLDEARHAFEQAADTARRGGHSALLGKSALHLSGWFNTFFTVDLTLLASVEEGLNAVGEADSALRASLMAKLAAARYWAGDREGGLALSDQAVELARGLDDRRAFVSALWVRCELRWGPEDVEGRLATATEIAALAESIGDYQRALRAHEMRFTALLEMGDVPGVEAEVLAYEILAKKSGEQFGIVERFRAALALMRGDFQETELKIRELLALAERRQDPALVTCGRGLGGILREERGLLDPVFIENSAKPKRERSPALAASNRIILALSEALLGRRAEAAADLESLAKDNFAALYRDWNWLENLRNLSILAVMLREVRYADAIYNLMLPYANRNITAGWGDYARGSAALSLGALARLLGRLADAEMHFEQALCFNRRMGARPSIVRTQFEYGRMLLARGQSGDSEKALNLLGEALAMATALGMEALQIRIPAVLDKAGPTQPSRAKNQPAEVVGDEILRKEGEFWTVSFGGKIFRIKQMKGLDYIAYLMRYPDREFHALALVAGAEGANLSESMPQAVANPAPNEVGYGAGDAGEMLDEKAKAAYRERLDQLRQAVDEAKERGDLERAAGAEDEIDALHRELSRATGRGGRDRRASSDVERGRLNVTRAIKAAIEKITENDPTLGRLLSRRIRTGTFCCYIGEPAQNERDRQGIGPSAGRAGSIEAVAAAAVAEPRDLLAQAAPDGTVTILFSDVEDSSVLVERLGDLRAHDVLKAHNEIVREQVTIHQGFEVKSMGDGFMIAFASARRALQCAIGVQRALATYRESRDAEAIRVRIGLHVGETIKHSDDFFGKTVILAARIAALARGGEILVSSTFRDLTESAGDLRFEPLGEVQLKGLSGKHSIFRAVW